MGGTFLQLFFLANAFLIGMLTLLALQHAYAHFRPHRLDEKNSPHPQPSVSQAVKRRLLKQAEAHYQTILDRSAAELEKNLLATTSQLSKQLDSVSRSVIRDEAEQYQKALQELRQTANAALADINTETSRQHMDFTSKLEAKQAELEAKLVEQYETRLTDITKRLNEQEAARQAELDAKLADAVISFLQETLPHEVDLGAQVPYLLATLDEHKAELIKGVTTRDA